MNLVKLIELYKGYRKEYIEHDGFVGFCHRQGIQVTEEALFKLAPTEEWKIKDRKHPAGGMPLEASIEIEGIRFYTILTHEELAGLKEQERKK